MTAHAQGAGQVERALGAGVDELAHTPWTRLSDEVIQTAALRMRIVSTLDILSFGRDTPEIRTALDNLRRFHVAGGSIAYGTDLGNGSIPPGIHTREALLMVEAGLEPEEVLEAMIRAPLAPDAPADLIVLRRSPLEDLRALDDVTHRDPRRAGRGPLVPGHLRHHRCEASLPPRGPCAGDPLGRHRPSQPCPRPTGARRSHPRPA